MDVLICGNNIKVQYKISIDITFLDQTLLQLKFIHGPRYCPSFLQVCLRACLKVFLKARINTGICDYINLFPIWTSLLHQKKIFSCTFKQKNVSKSDWKGHCFQLKYTLKQVFPNIVWHLIHGHFQWLARTLFPSNFFVSM